MNIGVQGHVCFLLLAPRVERKGMTEQRDAVGNIIYKDGIPEHGPVLVERDIMTAETFPTGETACQLAHITSVNPDGTINASGWNVAGEPRQWVKVVVADAPEAREDDPAGHVFHTTCPYGR